MVDFAILMWVFYIPAQIADIWTTKIVLEQGGYEQNGWVQRLMDVFNRLWGVPKVAFFGGVAIAAEAAGHHWVIALVSLVTAGVALRNYSLIK